MKVVLLLMAHLMIPLREPLKEAKKEPTNQKKAKIPTEAQGTTFEKAYTMDATDDATYEFVLRYMRRVWNWKKIYNKMFARRCC